MSDGHSSIPYQVLARKYRPADFSEVIGQDALVRTLTNAFASGRIAHAFILSGVRGVGKTTTARIIARALNCIGPDGTGGPTATPCGVCEHCRQIAEDRHVDVLEMDAASRTGVDDIRELIDGVLYRPATARTKVYIIDEVHMLTRNAFNALLKTLEEPPEHVKFVFATTELRKVPVTVLSRCQRFDLKRVDHATLAAHFAGIAGKEGVALTDGALRLIVRAADGSVRDGLSLLDQAIALNQGAGEITEAAVRDMLGLADGGRLFDLFEALMAGDAKAALDCLDEAHGAGADPLLVLEDLIELTGQLTRIKIVPGSEDGLGLSDTARARAAKLAEALSLPVLGRAWQILLKGLEEARVAPHAEQAAEMVCIRLAYAADLPSPAELVERLRAGDAAPAAEPAPPPKSVGAASPPPADPAPAPPAPAPAPPAPAAPASFEEVVALFAERREGKLHAHLMNNVRLVRFEDGLIEYRGDAHAPPDLAREVAKRLEAWTGRDWSVRESDEDGQPSLRSAADAAAAARRARAESDPSVQAALQAFPGAKIASVRDVAAPEEDESLAPPPDEIDEEDPS